MASKPGDGVKAAYLTFSNNAALHVLLPRSHEVDASAILRHASLDDLLRLPSRRNLFFDERAHPLVVLKADIPQEDLRSLLPSLELTLAAHATDAVPQGNGNAASASGKHDLTSKTIPLSNAVDVVSGGEHTFVIWKPELDLPRPRARLQRPAVYFTVHLSLSSDILASSRNDRLLYLDSLEPLPANVLEPLQFTPSLSGTTVYLPENRLTKVAPTTTRGNDDVKPIRAASKRAFPIVPALFTRIRYSGLADSAVASLHLETSQVITGSLLIRDVKLSSPEARVESLNAQAWPTQSFAGDEIVLLFKLVKSTLAAKDTPSSITVRIIATVTQDESQTDITVNWQTTVDLSQPTPKPTYNWSRPLSASTIRPPARPSFQADSKAGPLDMPQASSPNESGITFHIWTTSIIPLRLDFKIYVQCINRSDRTRRFAIVVLEPKKRSMQIQASSSTGKHHDLVAKVFDSPLQAQQPPDVLDLNPDVRIGPVAPGASYETELKFWAATTGILDLGILRIVDLDTRQTVDVRDLPDVVVLDPSAQ